MSIESIEAELYADDKFIALDRFETEIAKKYFTGYHLSKADVFTLLILDVGYRLAVSDTNEYKNSDYWKNMFKLALSRDMQGDLYIHFVNKIRNLKAKLFPADAFLVDTPSQPEEAVHDRTLLNRGLRSVLVDDKWEPLFLRALEEAHALFI
jgi:hypothetical protein